MIIEEYINLTPIHNDLLKKKNKAANEKLEQFNVTSQNEKAAGSGQMTPLD
jgi:hypothetical protein